MFASREKEKRKKKRKRKEKCAYMCEQTLPRHAQVVLTATMHDMVSTVLTLGMLPSNCTLLGALPCFFRSRYVRAATLLAISQARK